MSTLQPLALDQPALYQIKVQGRINGEYGRWIEGKTVEVSEGETVVTTVVARVVDQAELHGILQALYALGLPLLSLLRLE